MKKEQREWCLFLVMAVLIVAVVLLAWLDVPRFEAVSVAYGGGEEVTSTTAASAFTVSLNTATVAELTQLNGLGEKTAQKIIAYREENGYFLAVEELLNVDGIGEHRLESWRPYLTL